MAEGRKIRQVLKAISTVLRKQVRNKHLASGFTKSPGDGRANPVQRRVCFPSGSLLSLPKHCLVWGPLRGRLFSAC